MGRNTSMDAEISLDLYAHVQQDVDVGHLADTITTHVKVLQDYHKTDANPLASFDSVAYTPTPSSQIPPSVIQAKEQIIDSALRLLELTAGPSKTIAIACSQVQFISALKWLIHFRIFEIVPKEWSISVDSLANEARVPASELVRMLRIAMVHHVFVQTADNTVRHNYFSSKLAKDKDFLQGLPFFVDVVMPASAEAVAATIKWPGSREATETARNLAFKDKLDFDRHLIINETRFEYVHFMNLFNEGRQPSSTMLAGVIRDTINWSLLERDALVIDVRAVILVSLGALHDRKRTGLTTADIYCLFFKLGSCSPHFWELAELYPHLQFEAICPEDKIDLMTNIVMMNHPALLASIRFQSDDRPLPAFARVYLMIGMLHRKSDKQIVDMLDNVYENMGSSSRLIIVDSILSDAGEAPLATKRMWHCRDITMQQLQNSGDRTLSEVKKLVEEASLGKLSLKCHTRQPGTTIATLVFRDRVLGGRQNMKAVDGAVLRLDG